MMRLASSALLFLLLLFLAAPAAIVILSSFNTATSFPSPFEGFTLGWYAAIFRHPEFVDAFEISAIVAVASASTASCLGTAAAYGLAKRPTPLGTAIASFFIWPLLVPQIVLGLAVLQIAGFLGKDIGLAGLIAAHAVCGLPFCFRLARSGLASFDFTLEEAAESLGATAAQVMRFVVLPQLRRGLVAGFCFAFILSFVNLPLSLFLTSPATATLPIEMFAYVESRIDPMIAAISSISIGLALIVTILMERVFKIRIAG